MDIVRKFDTSEPDWEIKQKIWDRFLKYYTSIGKLGFFIRYPNFWYKLEGIVSPRQIIAWIKLIRIIGCEAFNKIPLSLNRHSDGDNIFFLSEYEKHFHDVKNLIITFTCGYFWKFVNKGTKRKTMKKFVEDKIKNGCKVNIFTQDKTLRKEINKDFARNNRPCVKTRFYRMDIHSTIVEPRNKKDKDKTLLFMEFPHTERTEKRLEAYVTIEQLKSFGCKEKQINALLRFLKRQRYMYLFTKSIPSYFDLALNWGFL